MSENEDLSFVETEALLTELHSRYHVAIFTGYKQMQGKALWVTAQSTGEWDNWSVGPLFALLGLLRTRTLEIEAMIQSAFGKEGT